MQWREKENNISDKTFPWKLTLSEQSSSFDLKWHNLKFIMKSIFTVKYTDLERFFCYKNMDAMESMLLFLPYVLTFECELTVVSHIQLKMLSQCHSRKKDTNNI